ncbi:hypothetical protein [Cytobacillus firmus]|uniref:Uncharacterized protein n=1 Tax=Cytobacillus firmus DS1 TaxID=1307436 RepID=W7LC29_CYTFI|nr:hypothetical protein [Cytobacillus firmus]EWG12731.1 hypothetical protein PBF_04310 [Cytobacillus firmus DS1]
MVLATVTNPTITYEIPIYIVYTILGTLIAAIIAQFLSHYLSGRRDRKKDFMQKYQDLYSNTVAPISNYMAIKTNPRKLHDVHHNVVEEDLLEITINNLKENIKYASPVCLQIYERYFGYGYYEDGWGINEDSDKHSLVYFLLDDMIRTSRCTGVFSRSDRNRLKKLKYYYGVCAMALNFFDMVTTEQILSLENFYGVKKIKYRNLGRDLISLDRNNMANHLLKHISTLKNIDKEEIYSNIIEPLKLVKNK